MSTYRFWVEVGERDSSGCLKGLLFWKRVAFAESNSVQYCHGFLDACSSFYPSRPYRICKRMPDGSVKVLREEKGKGKVHTNKGA